MKRDKGLLREFTPIVVGVLLTALFLVVAICAYSRDFRLKKFIGNVASTSTPNAQHVISKIQSQKYFIENDGQIQQPFAYYFKDEMQGVYFGTDGVAFQNYYRETATSSVTENREQMYVQKFVNSNIDVAVKGESERITKVNYFIGGEKKHTKISTYDELLYKDLYSGIDLVYRFEKNDLKYEYVIAPGADYKSIEFSFDGVQDISLDEQRNLIIQTQAGTYTHQAPFIYQMVDGRPYVITGGYTLIPSTTLVSFEVGDYDRELPLIIDPILHQLNASTFVGDIGGGSGYDIYVNDSGKIYVLGVTGSTNFPTTPGVYDTTFNSNNDIVITRFSNDLSTLEASTFLGGSGSDIAVSFVVGSDNKIYVSGTTGSTDFPTSTPAAFGEFRGGFNDIFVSKLSLDLSALEGSTYLGGSAVDLTAHMVQGSDFSIYVGGETTSADFPTTTGAYDIARGSSRDLFITNFSSDLSTTTASTYLGGDLGEEYGGFVFFDSSGSTIFITGNSSSSDYPTTPGAYKATSATADAVASRFSLDLTTLSNSTFLGGSSEGEKGIAGSAGSAGNIYIAGITSDNFPTTGGAYDTSFNGGTTDLFVASMPDNLGTLTYSSYLGGSSDEAPIDMYIGGDGEGTGVYLVGTVSSSDFPTSTSCYDGSLGGASDLFVAKLSANLSALNGSTYIGGSAAETQGFVFVDSSGNVYITGSTWSNDFPTTPGVYDAVYEGINKQFISRFDYESPNAAPSVSNVVVSAKHDGTQLVDVSLEMSDADLTGNGKLKIQFMNSMCSTETGLAMVVTSSISASVGTTPAVDNTATYHVGTASGWIDLTATNTLSFDWTSGAPSQWPDNEGIFCLAFTPNDGIVDGGVVTTTIQLDNVEPTAPGALTVYSTSTTSVVLNLGTTSTDNNFSEYKIYYSTTTPVTVSSPSLTSSTDANLATSTFNGATTTLLSSLNPNTRYYANIWAYDSFGNGTSSTQELSFYTLASAPTSVSVHTDGLTQITLSWLGNGTYYYAEDVANSGRNSGWISGLLHSFTGLTASTAYTFHVKARNGDGIETGWSSEASGTTQSGGGGGTPATPDPIPDTTAPTIPSQVALSSKTSSTISITWSASTDNVGVVGYKIFRENVEIGTASGVSYTDVPLTPSTIYTYTVKAYDAAGNISGASTELSITTDGDTPGQTPSGSVAINSGALYTNSTAVTLKFVTQDTNEFMASLASDFGGASYRAILDQTSFILSSGDGEKIVHVRLKNDSGIFDTSTSIILDTLAPATPSVNAIDTGIVNRKMVRPPSLSGVAEPFDKIIIIKNKESDLASGRIYLAAAATYYAQADAEGAWSYTFASFFEQGNYSVLVVAEDKAGNQSEATRELFTIDAQEPKPVCGNSILEEGEQCDKELGLREGYTCSARCLLVKIPAVCGNGIVEEGEQCDGVAGTRAGYECNLCVLVKRTQDPVCGNSIPESGETCDDGNRASNDGCSSSCQIEQIPGTTEDPLNGGVTSTSEVVTSTELNATSTPTSTPTTTLILAQEFIEQVGDVVVATTDAVVKTAQVVGKAVRDVVQNPEVQKANTRVAAPAVVTAGAINVATAGFSVTQVVAFLRYIFSQVFLLFRRRKQKKWGVVYNAFTKQPIGLATIRLVDNTTNSVVRSQVTDIQGRYFMTIPAGSFHLEVQRQGFGGFSEHLKKTDEDTTFTNLYHGEKIDVSDVDKEINYNIPLDPENADKPTVQILRDHTRKAIRFALSITGLVASIISFIISPSLLIGALVGMHLLFYAIFYVFSYRKLSDAFGHIISSLNKRPVGRAVVRVFDSAYNKLVETAVSDRKGRYAVLLGPSTYYVTYEKPGFEKKQTPPLDFSSAATKGEGGVLARDEELKPVEELVTTKVR